MELEKIGRYTVTAKIGQGGMGEVFKAHDPVLNRDVAVKTMSASMMADPEQRRRFLREAQSAAHLNHPNIVTVYELGEDKEKTFIAMELLEGRDLKQLLGTPRLARLEDKLQLIEQVCDGVAHAHSKDVVHRDLKPANIHVQPNGQVKIMDFGLARFGHSDMTRTGVVMGTPNYMAPEQVRGERVDARSDVFSLGALCYEVLTNHKAFEAESTHAILFRVLDSDPDPVRERARDVPEILSRFVEKALAKDPARRFRDAGEMAEAVRVVRRYLEGEISEGEGFASLHTDSQATVLYPTGSEPTIMETPVRAPARGEATVARGPETQTRIEPTPRVPRGSATRAGTVRRTSVPAPGSSRGVSRVTPRPSIASRLLLVLAVVLVGIGIVVVLPRVQGPPPPRPPDVAPEQIGALREAVVATQIDLGRQSLRDKNYKEAVARAQSALETDRESLEAKQLLEKAKGSLKELDDAAAEARASFDAGDTERASRALAKVLAIDPNHPVADELGTKLNRYFRGQALEARRAMDESRLGAQRASAGARAPFGEAAARTGEAEALFAKGEFAVATRKFLDARDGFERARRAAEAPLPTSLAPHPSLPAADLNASQTPAITLPQATLAEPPKVAARPPDLPAEEPAIRNVLESYGRAIQSKDVAAFKAVKPNLSLDEEKRFREIFKAIKSYQVNISVDSIQIEGGLARVRVSRRDVIDGKPVSFQQTIVLAKSPAGWGIQEIAK